ncbi:PREDICTED: xyloglucan endotransglucosylase/hydrolase protein 31-like [Ipomoea nil]|uniref:xyloglucan endotransglucosylase/hydrolase protein 31-like n=1 Tax=Ipomoea nil TaxID=35883 RepID=UPI0009009B3F|nr:PREDICTED: xyloglucan endotransglucosylase/hydrolase protein 31-like [Ipomoea nil]
MYTALHLFNFHHYSTYMALHHHHHHQLLLSLAIIFLFTSSNNAQAPPSPGYYPSTKAGSLGFNQGFKNLWGPEHQSLDKGTLSILLEKAHGGSGFKSLKSYGSVYIGASMKLQPGYTAGVVTCLYLSNTEQHPKDHDEIDIEFLGTTPGKPYTLHTNIYMKGSGDGGHTIGREVGFKLWFDPTKDFHHYAILWNPSEIIFFVDDVPIRHYPRMSEATFPQREMYVYGSIWDGSSWATENGKYKADYKYQPFIGKYKDFKVSGCAANASAVCRPIPGSPKGSTGLSNQQIAAMAWVQKNHKAYDYCQNPNRDRTQTPEC